MKNLVIINILLLFVIAISCHPDKFPGKSLSIKNNSESRIYFWISDNYSLYHYPDTILPTNKPLYINSSPSLGGAGSGINDPDWNNIYSQLPQGKLSIYFFDKYANNQAEWEEVRVNHFVIRKDITFEELKNNDYIIYYP